MNLDFLQDDSNVYSVILFLLPDEIATKKRELERIGNYKHVKLVVQPCPYEGIEFLYRVAHELVGHQVSLEKDIFWQALFLKKAISQEELEEISNHHHAYLCGILEQDPKKVGRERKALERQAKFFV